MSGIKNRKKLGQMQTLYPGQNVEKVYKEFCRRTFLSAAAVFLVFLMFFILQHLQKPEKTLILQEGQITRPGYGEGSRNIDVKITARDEGDVWIGHEVITVKEREYGERELKQAFLEARAYIDCTVKGNNLSLDHVEEPLNLIRRIPNSSIRVAWNTDRGGVIEQDGTITEKAEEKAGQVITITSVLSWEDVTEEYPIFLRVYPKEKTKADAWEERALQELGRAEEESRKGTVFTLPDGNGDMQYSITDNAQETNNSVLFLILGAGGGVLAIFSQGKSLDKKMEKRRTQLLMDYPDIIQKFTLLLNAGMTISRAWEKIAVEYQDRQEKGRNEIRYAYEEMNLTRREIRNGVPERKAYAEFGKRTGLLPYMKWASLLDQNMRKGTRGLVNLLELEALNAAEERRELAKRLGEEAGTRLIWPMLIMLLLVLAIIMIPAFTSFS